MPCQEETVAEEEFKGVQVSVETKPEVDEDEEGEGDIPTPDDNEAGKIDQMLMTKHGSFGHMRGGGIAKNACGNCAFHAGWERCLAQPKWTLPRTVYQRP
jgi:hypothetical protein